MRALRRFQPDFAHLLVLRLNILFAPVVFNVQIQSYVSQILAFASILVNTVICVLN